MYTILYDPTHPACNYIAFFSDGSRTVWYDTLQEALNYHHTFTDRETIESSIEEYPGTVILLSSETPISLLTHPELFI